MRKTLFLIAALLIASTVADVKLVTSEFTDKTFADSAVSNWYVTSNKNNKLTSTCGDQSIFGGYDVFGVGATASKDYNSGVDQYELTISFDLYSIDSWDTETFSVYVDDNLVYSYTAQYSQPSPKPVNCGSTAWGDRLSSVSVKFPHYRRNFNVRMTTNLNQDANDESWGIKNFQILAKHGGGNSALISQEFNQYDFKASLDGWTLVGIDTSNAFTSCNGNKLFGGFNTMGKGSIASKTYSNLPGHYGLIFSFDLWLIDSPDGNDYVQVIADGQMYRFYRPDWNYGDAANFLCGVAGWSERVVRVNLFVPHRGSSINLSIRGVFDENKDNESFGIRNLRVITLGCSSSRCKQVTSEFNDASFANAPDWTDLNGNDVKGLVQTCANVSLFGPHSTNGVEKVYNSILPHSGVRIFFRVISLGTWAADTNLQIFVNDVLANPNIASEFTKNKICTADTEHIRNFFVDVPHSSSFLDLSIKTVGFKADTQFSIRDLSITSYVEEGQTLLSAEFNQVNFDNTDSWTVAGNLQNRRVTTCGKYSLFGGYNAFGLKTSISKVYSNVPQHDFVVLTFSIYFIDTWDSENFNVLIDDQVVKKMTKSSTWGGQQQLCGRTDSSEEVYFVQVYVPHSASTLKIGFSDELNQTQDDESWGIRDIVVVTGVNLAAGSTDADTSNCITVFTACNFGGQSLAVCDDIPDLKAVGWTTPIKSISIPAGKSIKVYKSAQYKGDFTQFKDNQACLTGSNFLLINKAFNIDVSHETNRLRHSKQ